MPSLKKHEVQQNVYELALERTRHAFDLFDHIAVMFSGGKDSTAVLNIALEVAHERNRLPLHVVHYDEEAMPYEVEHYVRRVAQRPDVRLEWYCLQVKHTNACSSKETSWICWDESKRDLWVREMPPEAITTLAGYNPTEKVLSIPELKGYLFPPEKYGTVGALMGIRAGESLVRHQSVTRRTEENYIVALFSASSFGGSAVDNKNIWKVYPVYDWQTEDVWTAPKVMGWDYCAAYDLMEMAGISHYEQRVAPPYGTQPSRRLWTYKTCFPDIWPKMAYRVPGAQTAALYARTELYAEGGVVKDPNQSWEQYIEAELGKYNDPNMQRQIADRLRQMINRHMDVTGGLPILDDTPHPNAGVTWELMAKIVARRDNKNRIKPYLTPPHTDKYQPALDLYMRSVEIHFEEQGAINGDS